MLAKPETELVQELKTRFPLLQALRFRNVRNQQPEDLPPAIALFAAMTDPRIAGSTCLVLPSQQEVAIFTAILTALQTTAFKFPTLLDQYTKSFKVGDRVRVLPSGHIFLFGGLLAYENQKFFRLRLLSGGNASRTFPISDCVRLEKTTADFPKGKGQNLGAFERSKLDFVIGTMTGGNNALLTNAAVLITTQRSFIDFLENTLVSAADYPEHEFPLSEVIPWGTVTAEGQLEFKTSAAASGTPMIAVTSRPEYVANLCRLHGANPPRIIVDGARRLKDIQAADDIFDHGKTLIIADHSDLDALPEIQKRGCQIWQLPEGLPGLVQERDGILQQFCKNYYQASHFSLHIHACKSDSIDNIYKHLQDAARILSQSAVDDTIMRFVSVAYSRLLDLCSLVHELDDVKADDFKESILETIDDMRARAMFVSPDAYKHLDTALRGISEGIASRSSAVWTDKQNSLMHLLEDLRSRGENPVVVGCSGVAVSSAASLFAGAPGAPQIVSLGEYLSGGYSDSLILTGWPRARHFKKLSDSYLAKTIYALAYEIERSFFAGAQQKRKWLLSRWDKSAEGLVKITGLNAALHSVRQQSEPRSEPAFLEQKIDIEDRLSKVRKGAAPADIASADVRRARYVGFVGSTYSYMTEHHSVPNVTGILRGDRRGDNIGDYRGAGKAVPMVTISDLSPGDLILFRVSADTDKDIIRFLAEHMSAPGEYERVRARAESWKAALRAIGSTPEEIARELKKYGLNRTVQSMRWWLSDVIGPAQIDDLVVVARAARDGALEASIPEIWKAITTTRGAHMTAGFKLSQLLVQELPNQVPELSEEETIVELTVGDIRLGKVAIVEIEDISETLEARSSAEVNRLLWDHR